jgi:hypothetical protein
MGAYWNNDTPCLQNSIKGKDIFQAVLHPEGYTVS